MKNPTSLSLALCALLSAPAFTEEPAVDAEVTVSAIRKNERPARTPWHSAFRCASAWVT